jgi:adenylate cyclase class IV
MKTQEIECRFLEIDKDKLIQKLLELGATDKREVLLEEIIMYDPAEKWRQDNKFIRLRKAGDIGK